MSEMESNDVTPGGVSGSEGHGKDHTVEIILDGKEVISPSRWRTGLQIRELGPVDRVEGFETQQVNAEGKKVRTIRDDDLIELHKHEGFRTVPNHGGPGATAV